MPFLVAARRSLYTSVHLFLPRFLSSSNPDPNSLSMAAHYLVSSFGIPPAKAVKISRPIAYLKSPHNPDAVCRFLEHEGFGESDIKTLITWCPSILCSSVQNTLYPNLRALYDTGLSTSALTQILLSGPSAFLLRSAVPRIMFWRDFVGTEESALVSVFKRNRGLINLDINGGIATKLSFLQGHGFSTHDIQRILCIVPGFITSSFGTMDDVLERTKELGFDPQSKMFPHGLHAMKSINRETLRKKMELLESFGWSKDDYLSALKKSPTIAGLSEENIRAKMAFLLGEARLDLSYITFRPLLLSSSLEKRLRPRNHVMCLLESKDLLERIKDPDNHPGKLNSWHFYNRNGFLSIKPIVIFTNKLSIVVIGLSNHFVAEIFLELWITSYEDWLLCNMKFCLSVWNKTLQLEVPSYYLCILMRIWHCFPLIDPTCSNEMAASTILHKKYITYVEYESAPMFNYESQCKIFYTNISMEFPKHLMSTIHFQRVSSLFCVSVLYTTFIYVVFDHVC